jgi:hypothetical protein
MHPRCPNPLQFLASSDLMASTINVKHRGEEGKTSCDLASRLRRSWAKVSLMEVANKPIARSLASHAALFCTVSRHAHTWYVSAH